MNSTGLVSILVLVVLAVLLLVIMPKSARSISLLLVAFVVLAGVCLLAFAV